MSNKPGSSLSTKVSPNKGGWLWPTRKFRKSALSLLTKSHHPRNPAAERQTAKVTVHSVPHVRATATKPHVHASASATATKPHVHASASVTATKPRVRASASATATKHPFLLVRAIATKQPPIAPPTKRYNSHRKEARTLPGRFSRLPRTKTRFSELPELNPKGPDATIMYLISVMLPIFS
jgi:hypothetical protein